MVDPKRLIESMELCMGAERDCQKCMYWETENDCRDSMIYDAVELLKEQEPVKPKKWIPKGQTIAMVRGYYCVMCDTSVARGDRFCHWCGRGLIWDEETDH